MAPHQWHCNDDWQPPSTATLSTLVDSTLWLCSHGGVSSEYVDSLLSTPHHTDPPYSPRGRTAHYPHPLSSARPAVALYLFGDLYHAMNSSLLRHPDNARKLTNNKSWPCIPSLDALPNGVYRDPIGVAAQYTSWTRDSNDARDYAILLAKATALARTWASLCALVNLTRAHRSSVTCRADAPYIARQSSHRHGGTSASDALKRVYGSLAQGMDAAPPLALSLPRRLYAPLAARAVSSVHAARRVVANTSELATLACQAASLTSPCRLKAPAFAPQLSEDGDDDTQIVLNVRTTKDSHLVVAGFDPISREARPPVRSLTLASSSSSSSSTPSHGWSLPRWSTSRGHSGPEDPRFIRWQGKGIVIFNHPAHRSGCADSNQSIVLSRLLGLHVIETAETIVLPPPPDITTPGRKAASSWSGGDAACKAYEKNWSPFVLNGSLHFLYQHEPLQVLRLVPPKAKAASNSLLHDVGLEWVHHAVNASTSASSCNGVRGGSPLLPWRGGFYVGVSHKVLHCHGLHGKEPGNSCTAQQLKSWHASPTHCNGGTCESIYRSVLVVLDAERWSLSCSSPIGFEPPPDAECRNGWGANGPARLDVQYVHSLRLSSDGREAIVGVEFENRCPSTARVDLLSFAALVDQAVHAGGRVTTTKGRGGGAPRMAATASVHGGGSSGLAASFFGRLFGRR